MKVFHNISALSLAALRAVGPDEEKADAAWLAADEAIKADYKGLFDDLLSGRIDYFYIKDYPVGCGGRGSAKLWTRSTRPGVLVQRTSFLIIPDDPENEYIPLSHADIRSFDDMAADCLPDDVEVLTA